MKLARQKIQILCDLTHIWNLKRSQTHTRRVQKWLREAWVGEECEELLKGT
jgi:hypothetical protein